MNPVALPSPEEVDPVHSGPGGHDHVVDCHVPPGSLVGVALVRVVAQPVLDKNHRSNVPLLAAWHGHIGVPCILSHSRSLHTRRKSKLPVGALLLQDSQPP